MYYSKLEKISYSNAETFKIENKKKLLAFFKEAYDLLIYGAEDHEEDKDGSRSNFDLVMREGLQVDINLDNEEGTVSFFLQIQDETKISSPNRITVKEEEY